MKETTTIRVTADTRARLRELAEADGVTLDEELARLTRSERQRRMGEALAAAVFDEDDKAWVDAGVRTVSVESR
jgi:predicted transcriptional regulator